MQLNLKSEEAYRLATEVAEATGTTLTKAVTDALRERRDRLERERTLPQRLAKLREMTADIRSRLPADMMTNEEFDAWMYDENGLPH